MTDRCAYCGNDGYLKLYEFETNHHGRWVPRSTKLHPDCAALFEQENGIGPSTPAAGPAVSPNGNGRDGPSAGGIPFIITHGMKAALRGLGYTDEQIREMTPAEAHQILGPPPPVDGTGCANVGKRNGAPPQSLPKSDINDYVREHGIDKARRRLCRRG
jgi:hypothetical protein